MKALVLGFLLALVPGLAGAVSLNLNASGGTSTSDTVTANAVDCTDCVDGTDLSDTITLDADLAVSTFEVSFSSNVAITGDGSFGNAITDGFTFTGQVILPSNAAPRTNVTPLAAFSFIVNTGSTPDQLCISTGTLLSQWALASNFATACSN